MEEENNAIRKVVACQLIQKNCLCIKTFSWQCNILQYLGKVVNQKQKNNFEMRV